MRTLGEGNNSLHRRSSTYECRPGVNDLQEIDDVGKLEWNKPSMFSHLQIIVDEHVEDNGHVNGNEASKDHQWPLANADPRRVANTQEN